MHHNFLIKFVLMKFLSVAADKNQMTQKHNLIWHFASKETIIKSRRKSSKKHHHDHHDCSQVLESSTSSSEIPGSGRLIHPSDDDDDSSNNKYYYYYYYYYYYNSYLGVAGLPRLPALSELPILSIQVPQLCSLPPNTNPVSQFTPIRLLNPNTQVYSQLLAIR